MWHTYPEFDKRGKRNELENDRDLFNHVLLFQVARINEAEAVKNSCLKRFIWPERLHHSLLQENNKLLSNADIASGLGLD